jgi:catechol 2,3-dioxygenase-like lactoylglutathione lyase family enzyme
MLHHISFGVTDIQRSAAFYDAILLPLGYVRVWEDLRPGEANQAVGYGVAGGGDQLTLKHRPGEQRTPGPGFHLALAAPSREAVNRLFQAAITHSGSDNGPPGVRDHYGPEYYAAFVVDPDGHHIEAVFKGQ